MTRAHIVNEREVEMGELLASSASEEEGQETNGVGGSKRLVVGVMASALVLALLGAAYTVRSRHVVEDSSAERGDGPAVVSYVDVGVLPAGINPLTPAPMLPVPAPAASFMVPPAALAHCSLQPVTTPVLGVVLGSSVNAVERTENMADGNKCRDSEEEFGGVCLRKCECLLGIAGAVRKSEFSCCNPGKTNCAAVVPNPLEWETPSLVPCQGYAVSSADAGTACPHMEGACLLDEEQSFQLCYLKCSSVDPAFPFRVAAATCCKVDPSTDLLGCMPLVGQLQVTDPIYNTGGGCDDAEGAQTPCAVHYPSTQETEGAE